LSKRPEDILPFIENELQLIDSYERLCQAIMKKLHEYSTKNLSRENKIESKRPDKPSKMAINEFQFFSGLMDGSYDLMKQEQHAFKP
jgi:hypothetical protein